MEHGQPPPTTGPTTIKAAFQQQVCELVPPSCRCLPSPCSVSTILSLGNSKSSTCPRRPAVVPAPRLLLPQPCAGRRARPRRRLARRPRGGSDVRRKRAAHGAEPLAQAYAGHQFGGFRLNSAMAGRLLGEVIDPQARGATSPSRLGPARRCPRRATAGRCRADAPRGAGRRGHARAAASPPPRALAVVATGEPVYRDHALPGAVLTRVAASHIRVGTFEFFASRGYRKACGNWPITRSRGTTRHSRRAPRPYLALLRAVAERQAALVAQWMNVGFVHGVMNTDNMAICGRDDRLRAVRLHGGL